MKLLPALFLSFFLTAFLYAESGKETLTGSEVTENVQRVIEMIPWRNSSSMQELKEEAKKSNRMIFYLQIVGELDDGL